MDTKRGVHLRGCWHKSYAGQHFLPVRRGIWFRVGLRTSGVVVRAWQTVLQGVFYLGVQNFWARLHAGTNARTWAVSLSRSGLWNA